MLPIVIFYLTLTLALTFVHLVTLSSSIDSATLATTATTHTAYANASSTVENKEVCTLPAISLSLSKLFPLWNRATTPHRVIPSLIYSLASTTLQRSSNG